MSEADALLAFLNARLDDDERAVVGTGDLGWLTFRRPDGSMDHTEAAARGADGAWIVGGVERAGHASAVVVHQEAARLADIAAKRTVLVRFQGALLEQQAHPEDVGNNGYVVAMSQVAADMAAPCADHPDYRDAWRPA